jgi:hypothetical protein
VGDTRWSPDCRRRRRKRSEHLRCAVAKERMLAPHARYIPVAIQRPRRACSGQSYPWRLADVNLMQSCNLDTNDSIPRSEVAVNARVSSESILICFAPVDPYASG